MTSKQAQDIEFIAYFHLNKQLAILFIFIFSALLCGTWNLSFPNQGLNPCPLKWKHRVLNIGPPGKVLVILYT